MSGNRKYDVVIFGASGYTGKVVVEEMLITLARLGLGRQNPETENVFKWAIAGRSADKLDDVLRDASTRHGDECRLIPKVLADVNSYHSLKLLANQCQIILNCVGPYQLYGAQVVRACIAEGTHYVDVSRETIYLENLQTQYHAEAEDKGCYILASCGLSSIPTEIGINYIQGVFNGRVNTVDIYADFQHGMPKFNIGSWHSLVYSLSRANELKRNRKQVKVTTVTPSDGHFKKSKFLVHYSKVVEGWCFPFKSCDRSVAIRSQQYWKEKTEQENPKRSRRPVQVQVYMKSESWKQLFQLGYMFLMIWVLATFRIGRLLLHQFPKPFAAGFLQEESVLSKVKNSKVKYVLIGEGWKGSIAGAGSASGNKPSLNDIINDTSDGKPNKRVVAQIEGPESVYKVTAICMLQAALTLLEEPQNFPSKGGVYTPGVAFAKTSIVRRLHNAGLQFHTILEETF